jgi:Ti-type conjugative transfer relaxase TraA
MAIYHFHAQIISRKDGRSSIAAAAYRAGERLVDERTGKMHDYTRKSDIVNSAILLPENAPEAFRDRETLWNAVEKIERRKDSQLAREINIALPRELNDEQNWQLAMDYVKLEFVSKGMIADVAFHRGHGFEGEEQPHIHVMLTTREVTLDGFGQKERAWNSKALLMDWRERWAELHNERMAELGFDMRIDAGTLESQGINLEPHHYRNGMVDKRTGETFAEYMERAQRNGERLMEDPNIALTAITAQQSTFSRYDVAKFVSRQTADREQFNAVYAKVMAAPELVQLNRDKGDVDRYTTKELFAIEQKMIKIATDKAESRHFELKTKTVDRVIENNPSLSPEQQAALRHVTQGGDLASVVGFAGTGKSYMLGMAREAWEAEGYKVQGMALAGIAADSLQAGANIPSNTIANRLIIWKTGKEKLSDRDILVVDEAGMIGSRQMHAILNHAEQSGAKVVLVGDPEQLQAIDAGASFRAIIERSGFAQMSDIRRQKEEWQKEASRHFGLRQASLGLAAYERHGKLHEYGTKGAAISNMIEAWDETRSLNPDKTQIMLAFTHEEVKALNETARAIRHECRELGQERAFQVEIGERNFAEGDRIYFLKNDNKTARVKNGNLGVITQIEGEQFTVKLDAVNGVQREVSFNLKDYDSIDHGYAATVYKAQGITVDKTSMLASRYYDSHATYVGMTRHRDTADIYYSLDEFKNKGDLTYCLSRQKDKDVSLDYEHPQITEIGDKKPPLREPDLSETLKARDVDTLEMSEDRRKRAEERLAHRKQEKLDARSHKEGSHRLDYQPPDEARLKRAEERIQQRAKNREQEELARRKSLQTEAEAEAEFDRKIEALLKEDIGKDFEAMLSEPVPDYILEALETPAERMKRAEARLEQRIYTKASERDLDRIEMKTGLKLSMELQEGEEGIYRGTYEVAGRSYGLMEKDDGTAKLIPAQELESRERGHPMHIEKYTRRDGKELLKGVQHHVRERDRDQGLELSF